MILCFQYLRDRGFHTAGNGLKILTLDRVRWNFRNSRKAGQQAYAPAPAPIWGRGGAQPFRPSQFLDRAAAGQGLRRGYRDRQAENALDQVARDGGSRPKPNPRTTPS